MPLGDAASMPRTLRHVAKSAGAKLALAQPDAVRTIQASSLLNTFSKSSKISKIYKRREACLHFVAQDTTS
eukprot:8280555-Pyramimonas_sp.AAC.2